MIVKTLLTLKDYGTSSEEEDEVKSGCKQTRKFPTVKQKIEAVKCCIEICKGNKIEAWAYFADHPV